MGKNKSVGQILVEKGTITPEQLKEYREEYLSQPKGDNIIKKSLGEIIMNHNVLTEAELMDICKEATDAEIAVLNASAIERQLSQMITRKVAQENAVIPFMEKDGLLYLAMKDPSDLIAIEEARIASRKRIKPYLASPSSIDRTIANIYSIESADKAVVAMAQDLGNDVENSAIVTSFVLDESEDANSSPTVKYVNAILRRAVTEHASDIHIEASEKQSLVRIRTDGLLRDIQTAQRDLHAAIVARIKVMSNLDVAEKRIPQDGRTNVVVKGESVDLRISTLPTIYGEKVVIRLLRKTAGTLDREAIGLRGENVKRYETILKNHNGVVLIVGPTGSGKSTTMVTMMKILNRRDVNVMSLEDPVEYEIPGVNQVQINEATGMTFAKGLRSAMRQDPDIICVGEIRDGETADIAMRAAITGHLVISTLHTNDAVSTFERLKDVGVDPYLIASAMIGIISQRLVRKICPYCREEYEPDDVDLETLGYDPAEMKAKHKFYRGKGCPMCYETGYSGRTGVFEILTMNHTLRRAIAENKSQQEVVKAADSTGYSKLKESCLELVLSGVTTLDEMLRTVNIVE